MVAIEVGGKWGWRKGTLCRCVGGGKRGKM